MRDGWSLKSRLRSFYSVELTSPIQFLQCLGCCDVGVRGGGVLKIRPLETYRAENKLQRAKTSTCKVTGLRFIPVYAEYGKYSN